MLLCAYTVIYYDSEERDISEHKLELQNNHSCNTVHKKGNFIKLLKNTVAIFFIGNMLYSISATYINFVMFEIVKHH